MITVSEQEKVFHLNNGRISYIFYVMESGQLGHLYFGKALNRDADYLHMVETAYRPMSTYMTEGDMYHSYEHLRQEYPGFGTSDYRYPAVEVSGPDGSSLVKPQYQGFRILEGKKPLPGLPATYVEEPGEASTVEISMRDDWLGLALIL